MIDNTVQARAAERSPTDFALEFAEYEAVQDAARATQGDRNGS